MNKTKLILEQVLSDALIAVPTLISLKNAKTLRGYMSPAFNWKSPVSIFPFREKLQATIAGETNRLYGKDIASAVNNQLTKHFIIETGIHLSLPRIFDRSNHTESSLFNASIFQSLILSTSAHYAHGAQYHLSFSSGRVPLNNDNSGSTFQISAQEIFKLAPSKLNRTAQVFIPRVNEEKIGKLVSLGGNTKYSANEKNRINSVIKALENGKNFADQILLANSHLMNEVLLNTDIKQISLEYEILMIDFIADLLEDKLSTLHLIFSNDTSTKDFIDFFCDIPTGWKKDENPFLKIETLDNKIRIEKNYDGEMNIDTLSKKLRNREIIPRGVLIYYCLMIEAGLLPIGGMRQTHYCTEIRKKSITFLEQLHFIERAHALKSMPTHIATITPVWGITSKNPECQNISNYSDFLEGTLKLENKDLIEILDNVTGHDAFRASALLLSDQVLKDKNISGTERKEIMAEIIKTTNILIFS